MEFEVKSFSGKEAEVHLETIADLRMRVFRDFPYLYKGTIEYEKDYLSRYFNAPSAKFFVLFYGTRIVGVATCIPLSEEAHYIRKPFEEKGLDVNSYFYFGESLLERIYRGKGFGKLFFQYREEEALKYPQIEYTAFCAVTRSDDHPMKPDNYMSLEGFWSKMGYSPQPGLSAVMSWTDVDQEKETEKKLEFWVKKTQVEKGFTKML